MKYYDFIDREPKIGGLVVIEGTDSVLAQRALEALLDRLIPADMRALNLEVIDGPATEDLARVVADSVAAMPFLAERRVVAVRGCERLRAQPRRELWAVAEAIPAGNTLVLEDLLPPNKATKPEPFGALAGRKALRIDTTLNADARERLRARDARRGSGAKAEPRVIAALADSDGRPRRDRQRPREARARRERRSRSPTSSAKASPSRIPRRGTTPARWSKVAPPKRWRSPSNCSRTIRAARRFRWSARSRPTSV